VDRGRRIDAELRRYVQTFDPLLDDDCEEAMTCGEEHGRVVSRLDSHEAKLDDHETRLRTGEAAKGAIVEKLIWVFVTALICGGVSVVVSLLTAGAGG
jgi:hypothetical protein